MLILPGGNALSEFRVNKLLFSLQSYVPAIVSVESYYIHFAETSSDLNQKETTQLNALLNYSAAAKHATDDSFKLIIIPRPGTISPWSSKASDIAHNSGLSKINRIERGRVFSFQLSDRSDLDDDQITKLKPLLHDRMTEILIRDENDANALFAITEPAELNQVDIINAGIEALETANTEMGLALSNDEINYLFTSFETLGRNPTDVELMMFAQANSEHCRHKIFNAEWTIDNVKQEHSLFKMIRQTHEANPGNVLSAYHDNAAVMAGFSGARFFTDPNDHHYGYHDEDIHILMKVETHNHPTAISPYPGAATGSGGEIRDEAATGRGAKPKAGLSGFAVSNLKIPGFEQAWETDNGKPDRIVSALDIMLEGPIGAAAYNNEFGRPALCGYFRTYEQRKNETLIYGYHKPIMLAGGYGMIRESDVHKQDIPTGSKLIVLGGPAMLIGLGGGAASSMASGSSDASLDFASVQRDNPEMERRCQEVIDRCWALGDNNPIISIHDVGAGGLSNAMPELVSASNRGAQLELREIPNDEPGMSPMGVWCNESQERYVLAIAEEQLERFTSLCKRERAPYAILGDATEKEQLVLNDAHFSNQAIDIPMSVLLGKMPNMQRDAQSETGQHSEFDTSILDLHESIDRVLQLPTIASKSFLITIGDRSISGLVVRDQMVGPWQVPVADCAVTSSSYFDYIGEAMAIGERAPLALINAAASGRMAIAEAIMNISAARIIKLEDIALSANWMAACGETGQDAKLYNAVAAVSDLCKTLGIAIPVGKDSLSMNTVWSENNQQQKVTSPLSLNITAFARVADVQHSLTPQLQQDDDTILLYIDLANGKQRLAGSALCQVYEQFGSETPDLDDPNLLIGFFQALQILNESDYILAYHDRSDGGLFVTLVEMAFAGHTGIDIELAHTNDIIANLFNEELGAVIQIKREHEQSVRQAFINAGIEDRALHTIGTINNDDTFRLTQNETINLELPINELHKKWAATSFQIQSLRDNPDCAQQEFDNIGNQNDTGLFVDTTFELESNPLVFINTDVKPKVAILREQGVNGQLEMAAAFDRAGFDCVDVHMQDLIDNQIKLGSFNGLVACGGFSYGDVLGAGGGWAKSILYNDKISKMFETFFKRTDTFSLGVCNGCQMMSQLRDLIPGATSWPDFIRNQSEQFEARLVMVEIMESPAILFKDMAGSKMPVVVAHGEGRVSYKSADLISNAAMRYIDNSGITTETYPLNPNGSINGCTGFTNDDGRISIMMPHPERVFLRKQFSYLPSQWDNEYSPWMKMFLNARDWLN
ncbi:MAG: phosphoribosylformylglycinamidine synthase [marine bacterium B5-7]|nr:MAG: phosphoribosylformylglycinamidine synthase [marine bacterium B5-7]